MLDRPVDVRGPGGTAGGVMQLRATYDRSGAVQTLAVNGTPYVRALARNARGQRVLLVHGNNVMTRYAYDDRTFRLVRLRSERAVATANGWQATGPAVQDLTFIYDLVGNITAIEERTTGCGVTGTPDGRDRLERSFEYDPIYRLLSGTGRVCGDITTIRPLDDAPRCGSYPLAPNQLNAPDVTVAYRETYSYDPASNVLDLAFRTTSGTPRSWHRRSSVDGRAPTDWTSALTNRVTSVKNGSAPATALTYDAIGNLATLDSTRKFTWNHAGRLAGYRVAAGAGTSVQARYLYGSDGMRVKKWIRRGEARRATRAPPTSEGWLSTSDGSAAVAAKAGSCTSSTATTGWQ